MKNKSTTKTHHQYSNRYSVTHIINIKSNKSKSELSLPPSTLINLFNIAAAIVGNLNDDGAMEAL